MRAPQRWRRRMLQCNLATSRREYVAVPMALDRDLAKVHGGDLDRDCELARVGTAGASTASTRRDMRTVTPPPPRAGRFRDRVTAPGRTSRRGGPRSPADVGSPLRAGFEVEERVTRIELAFSAWEPSFEAAASTRVNDDAARGPAYTCHEHRRTDANARWTRTRTYARGRCATPKHRDRKLPVGQDRMGDRRPRLRLRRVCHSSRFVHHMRC